MSDWTAPVLFGTALLTALVITFAYCAGYAHGHAAGGLEVLAEQYRARAEVAK